MKQVNFGDPEGAFIRADKNIVIFGLNLLEPHDIQGKIKREWAVVCIDRAKLLPALADLGLLPPVSGPTQDNRPTIHPDGSAPLSGERNNNASD